MRDEYLEYLLEKYKEEQEVLQNELGSGTAKDFSDYRYKCGVIHGLVVAQNFINELSKRLMDAEDDI